MSLFTAPLLATALFVMPAALPGATPGAHQVSGTTLKSALLPANGFGSGFKAATAITSGRHLEHGPALFKVGTMKCGTFRVTVGLPGFGETASASDHVSSLVSAELRDYLQSVYQFRTGNAASSFFRAVAAKSAACRTFSFSAGGQTLRYTTKSVSKTKVGGHQAVLVHQVATSSKTPGFALNTYLLYTLDGADVFIVTSSYTPDRAANPSRGTVTLRLISRAAKLR